MMGHAFAIQGGGEGGIKKEKMPAAYLPCPFTSVNNFGLDFGFGIFNNIYKKDVPNHHYIHML